MSAQFPSTAGPLQTGASMAHGRSSGSLRRHKHDHKVHVSQFRNRLETIKKHHPVHRLGSDTKSSDDYFVPEPLIQNTLLKKEYIQGLLKDVTELRQPPPRTIDTIFKQCPIIFCILLEIGEGEWIERIVEDDESWDRSLPFSAKPTYLPERVWGEFSAVQRRFKPKKLGASVLSFDSESIVPYTSVVRMDVGGSAQIWRVTLHGAYDDFRSQREAVLKSAQPVVRLRLPIASLSCADLDTRKHSSLTKSMLSSSIPVAMLRRTSLLKPRYSRRSKGTSTNHIPRD